MMVGLGKAWVLNRVEGRLKVVPKSWIDRWLAGEVSLVDAYFREQADRIRPYKATALEIIEAISVDDLQRSLERARPHMRATWRSPTTAKRLAQEKAAVRRFLAGL